MAVVGSEESTQKALQAAATKHVPPRTLFYPLVRDFVVDKRAAAAAATAAHEDA
jgi:hypothetical protein